MGRKRIDSELGIFVQDAFKVSSRLTLDLGVRWDHFGPGNYSDGLIYNWDPATGNVIVPEERDQQDQPVVSDEHNQAGSGRRQESPSLRNFAPRVGAAWRPFGEKTVIRGSYGIFTETLGRFASVLPSGPFQLSESFFNSHPERTGRFSRSPTRFRPERDRLRPRALAATRRKPGTEGSTSSTSPSSGRSRTSAFALSYVGARDRGMNYNININKPPASLTPFNQSRRPYPQFVGATIGRDDGALNHNALSIEGRRRDGPAYLQCALHLHLEFPELPGRSRIRTRPCSGVTINTLRGCAAWPTRPGPCPSDAGRQFLANAPRVLDLALGGWQANWIAIMESGQYFTPSFSGADPSNTNTTSGRPDRLRDGNLPTGERTLERWFDTAAFAVPRPGTYGNTAQYALEGPGLHVHNLTVSKNFKIRERINFTFMYGCPERIQSPDLCHTRREHLRAGDGGSDLGHEKLSRSAHDRAPFAPAVLRGSGSKQTSSSTHHVGKEWDEKSPANLTNAWNGRANPSSSSSG